LQTGVLVIGGGITGAGILWDLALRGIDAVLVEQHDLGYGATGRCHGLLHSGCRYLVQDQDVALECYRENRILRKVAAGAVEDTGGLFVHLKGDSPQYPESWVEAAAAAGIPVEEIALDELLQVEPLLSPEVDRAFWVPDAAVDPFDLVWMSVRGAVQHGACVLTRSKVVSLLVRDQRVQGAVIENTENGERFSLEAEVVVNAAGAWAGQVAALAGISLELIYGKGSLLVFSQRLTRHVVNRLRPPGDGDILVPAKNVSLLGTTDIPVQSPDELFPTPREVEQLLELGEELVPGLAQRRVLRAFAGIRPLYDAGGAEADDRGVSRGFVVLDHGTRDGIRGFYSVVGGKLTTYRLMAEQAVDLVAGELGVSCPCLTAEQPLPLPGAGETEPAGGSPLVCECEQVSEEELNAALGEIEQLTPAAVRTVTRLALGPCQGTFCLWRCILHLYKRGVFSYEDCCDFLVQALNERWQGSSLVLWGDQLEQLELARGIYLQNFHLEERSHEI